MIYIYDFDGVLCDPLEDTVFRLDESPLDEEFIALGRKRYGITKLSTHVKRNRHLILQEVLYERRICPQIGPKFPDLATCNDPFYVLTARSGPGAVARVSQFFEAHNKRPEEMFFVGPVSKNTLLIDLCTKFDNEQLVFLDDNQHHIDEANSLGFHNLEVTFIDNKVETLYAKATDYYVSQADWLRSVSG